MTRTQSTVKPVPLEWVEKLFDRFTALYGAQLVAAMWQGANLADVQNVWCAELGKLSPEQMRAGVHSLSDAFPKPPTLPQLMAHCRAARVQQTDAAQLTDQRRADATQQAGNMQRLRAALAPLQDSPRRAGSAWAWRILERGKSASGLPLPSEVVRCAEDAIKNHARKGDQ